MASTLSQRLLRRYYRPEAHPYRLFEAAVDGAIGQATHTLLDAGCGRTMPVLVKYQGRGMRLIGVELVDFSDVPAGIEAYKTDLAKLPVDNASVDLIISRSVFEHLVDPESVYREFARVLKPGGRVIFLTANMWDYATLIAKMVPNRLHARIVRMAEGRAEEDTFPTAYRTNTRSAVHRLAAGSGFQVEEFRYLSQYPGYFMFSGILFALAMLYEKTIARFEMLGFLRGWLLVTLVKSPAETSGR